MSPGNRLPPAALVQMDASFEGRSISFYGLRGRICVIASDLGKLLGYAADGKKVVDRIRVEWSEEFIEGQDFDVLTGHDLREFKALMGHTPESGVSDRLARLAILYESGVDLVCVKTEKPQGRALRRYLVDNVFPKLRRGQPVLPGEEAPPVFAPASEARALALRAQSHEATLEEAIRLLGPAVDPRIPTCLRALAAPTKPSLEYFLRAAAVFRQGFAALDAEERPAIDVYRIAEAHDIELVAFPPSEIPEKAPSIFLDSPKRAVLYRNDERRERSILEALVCDALVRAHLPANQHTVATMVDTLTVKGAPS